MTAPTPVTHTELNAAANAVADIFAGNRLERQRTIDWSRGYGLAVNGSGWVASASGLSARATAPSRNLFLPVPMSDGGVTITRFRVRMKRGGVANFSAILYAASLITGGTTPLSTLTSAVDQFQTLDSGIVAIAPSASNALLIQVASANTNDEFAGAIVNYSIAP